MQRSLIFAGACILVTALPHPAVAQTPDAPPIMFAVVAGKLGIKPTPSAPRELELGQSATGMLADARKIEPFVTKTFHEGARVTATCVGPGRMRLEVEEMDPMDVRVEIRAIVTLRVADDGSLTKVPDRPGQKSP